MQCNVGNAEKVVRIIIGLGFFSLFYFLQGDARYWGLIGIIPIATALIGWCPISALLGINTCSPKQQTR
jgi:hypothetical protein